jgi:23S rRNA pseudouridine1911/1915/1917 synthase
LATEFVASPGRLDKVVAHRLGLARAEVQRAIAGSRVLVDGEPRSKAFTLVGGERVLVDLSGMEYIPSEGPPVTVRHQDEYLAVVVKPAGVPTHPTKTRRSRTLVNRLVGMGMPLSGTGGPERPGIVHRLDAGTSGLLIVAKDDETHRMVSGMLSRHEIERRYLALVRGQLEHDRFAVEAPLGRRAARVLVRRSSGKEAETAFEVRERFGQATLLEATPRTGRTHQIRVHLSSIDHPILGDRKYGGGGADARRLGLDRPFLHAWRLSFEHPVTRERMDVEEPLPDDLEEALRRLED